MGEQLNPLDIPGKPFEFEARNPNPSSSKTQQGPVYRISLEVDEETWRCFMHADTKGMLLLMRGVRYEEYINAETDPSDREAPYGQHAKQLKQSGFFRRLFVWECIGSDGEYLDWLRGQPCAGHSMVYHRSDSVLHNHRCEGDIVPAHVRRVANGAGTGIKPSYSAIPLCNKIHQTQHAHGESSIAPKEEWDKQRILHVERWAWERLKRQLGYEHWNEVPPQELIDWAKERRLEVYLPSMYQAEEVCDERD